MSAGQLFLGHLGFATPSAAIEALALVRDLFPDASLVLSHVRLEDHVVSIEVDGSMPSSLWSPCSGALAELAGHACTGHVTMRYAGDGEEFLVAAAVAPAPLTLGRAMASPWLPLEHDARLGLTRGGVVTPMEFAVTTRGETRALSMRDWLGVMVDLVPDGERLYAIPDSDALDEHGLERPQPRLRVWADLDRVPSTRLVAFPGKEILSLVRVVGLEDREVGEELVRGALRIDVETYEVPMHPSDLRERRRGPDVLRVWIARGRGLLAMER